MSTTTKIKITKNTAITQNRRNTHILSVILANNVATKKNNIHVHKIYRQPKKEQKYNNNNVAETMLNFEPKTVTLPSYFYFSLSEKKHFLSLNEYSLFILLIKTK